MFGSTMRPCASRLKEKLNSRYRCTTSAASSALATFSSVRRSCTVAPMMAGPSFLWIVTVASRDDSKDPSRAMYCSVRRSTRQSPTRNKPWPLLAILLPVKSRTLGKSSYGRPAKPKMKTMRPHSKRPRVNWLSASSNSRMLKT